MKAKRVGDPFEATTDVGPLARHDLRDGLHKQVLAAIGGGAKALLGAEIPAGPGAYYLPTVLAGVKPGNAAFDEELFGPVAALIEAKDEADAVRLANASAFGLGAAVFTRDLQRGERVARQFESGAAYVNSLVASDPRLPFGGVKESGYGRELGSFGIKEFVNAKTVYIKDSPHYTESHTE
jgi:succinate-semialdehyde dehydrogenase/glutarate-semialdehyde dehydrogenase